MTGRRTGGEEGAVIPIVAGAMVAILVIAAIVIDLGSTRSLRRDARATADAAASAGAIDVSAVSALAACTSAMAYAFANMPGARPSASAVSTECTNKGMGAACSSTRREAVLVVDDKTVRVVNPVFDTDRLMRGTAVGGGVTQSVSGTIDGSACLRVGVEITRLQSRFFGGVVSRSSETFSVHSVARFDPAAQPGAATPALVTLNQRACKAIDAGSGQVRINTVATSSLPGLAYSDSDGRDCGSGEAIFHSRAAGQIVASERGGLSGELGWFMAPTSRGYLGGPWPETTAQASGGSNYVGKLYARADRVTSLPVEKAYRCRIVAPSVQTLCATSDDEVTPIINSYLGATVAPAPVGFTPYGCILPPAIVGNAYVSCPGGVTIGSPLTISPAPLSSATSNPTVIFTGPVNVVSGGRLLVNTATLAGDPVPVAPAAQALLVVRGGVSMQSSSAAISMAQTTVVSSGGINVQGSPSLLWTPPTAGARKGLLYWTTGSSPIILSGSPNLSASGVFFAGAAPLQVSGGGGVNVERVQMWVDSMAISGGGSVTLRADPTRSITLSAPGTRLIR